MGHTTRRSFVLRGVAAASVLAAMHEPALADVDESDPQAVALGYRDKSSKVDPAKYPSHDASQLCSNCSHYQGKAGDRYGGCPLFGGKQVAAQGWCSGWAKKA